MKTDKIICLLAGLYLLASLGVFIGQYRLHKQTQDQIANMCGATICLVHYQDK